MSLSKQFSTMALSNETNQDQFEVPEEELPAAVACLNDLPPEVLEKILEKLYKDQLSLLRYRGINSLWKSIIDSIMERRCLAEFSKWVAHSPYVSFKPVPKITNFLCKFVSELEVPLPVVNHPPRQFLNTYIGSPFPSGSLLLNDTYLSRVPSPFEMCLMDDFLTGFGHYLTSLVISKLELDVESLVKGLEVAHNLKALRLEKLDLSKQGSFRTSLPALKDLSTLQLVGNKPNSSTETDENIISSLLSSYGPQLAHLEIKLEGYLSPFKWPTSNLKTMKVYNTSYQFLRDTAPPSVEYLSVIKLKELNSANIYDVLDFINKFASTLVELHLDMFWHEMMMKNRRSMLLLNAIAIDENIPPLMDPWTLLQEDDCMKSVVEQGGKLDNLTMIFPNLKKLAIPYPRDDIDVALVRKTFLPKFPGLKKLQFLWFKGMPWWYNWDTGYHTKEENIRSFLLIQNYWEICPKLQTILVVAGGNPNEEILYVGHK